MLRSLSPTRVTAKVAILVLTCALPLLAPASALAKGESYIQKAPGEGKALHLNSTTTGGSSGTGGASLVRTIVGLAIVLAVVWGLAWVLKRVKAGREGKAAGSGLASMASLPLGAGRSLQLVRAGSDYVLLGVAEHGVVPVYRYTEEQAREAGLLSVAASNPMLADLRSVDGSSGGPSQPPESPLDRLRRRTVRR
jgi:flagellar protein FliO/FliZ